MMMEMGYLKYFFNEKFGLNMEEMKYGMVLRKQKIIDMIRVNIGDTYQNYLMSPLSFDIYFETRTNLQDNLIWKVYFYEKGKETTGQTLKDITIQSRSGSIQIKLNVPHPTIERFSIRSLLKNGAQIKVTCLYKRNIFYEVTYDFEILKSSIKMPQDPFICLGFINNVKPPPDPKGDSAYLIRDLKDSQFVEYDHNQQIIPQFQFNDRGPKDLRDLGNGGLNLDCMNQQMRSDSDPSFENKRNMRSMAIKKHGLNS